MAIKFAGQFSYCFVPFSPFIEDAKMPIKRRKFPGKTGKLGLIGFVLPEHAGGFIFIILCYNRGYVHFGSFGNWVCFA